MKTLIRKYPVIGKYGKYILFTAAGALSGFIYWRFVGCRTGLCPITANWHTSVLFGSLIGFLAVPSGRKKEKPTNNDDHEN
jgi:hypothetical protein